MTPAIPRLTQHLVDVEGKVTLLVHAFVGMKQKFGAPAEADYLAFQTALGKVREHLRGLRIESQEADRAERSS
jgi:hypothetical protein